MKVDTRHLMAYFGTENNGLRGVVGEKDSVPHKISQF